MSMMRPFAWIAALLGLATAAAAPAAADGYHHAAKGYVHGPPASRACYKKVRTPDVYRTVRVKVLVRPAACRTLYSPARYGVTQRPVVVEPERVIYQNDPAVYRRVAVSELVRPAGSVWTRSHWMGDSYLCREDRPALYRERSARVMVAPPSVRAAVLPARVRMVDQPVLVQQASSHQICEPPVYQWVDQRELVEPGRVIWQPVAGGPPC